MAPLPAGAPLPNELHIGRAESRRLLGDPEGPWTEEGPLARFLRAFRAGAGESHVSIHIRDWHDPQDPATGAHLDHFGSHCVRGTPGAAFVLPLAPLAESGVVVDSAVLSDFVGTTLEATLLPLSAPPVRAGIVGVWTDFKVQYLAYELQARLGLRDVAVCSALTASRSRLAHRQALEHMAANLGVTVIDSIPEFLAWLGIETAAATAIPRPGRARPAVELPEGTSLDDEERRLVEHLYRECRSVRLAPIGGGYSGSRVFGSFPVDRLGRHEIPFVTKVDRHDRIARERVAVEGVENLLGANAPRLADYVDLETRGAIKYHFASMQAGQVRTLQRAFREAEGPAAARGLFDRVCDRLLRRLYQGPGLDRLDLFEYYGYQARYAESTLARVAELGEVRGETVRVEGLEELLPHPGPLLPASPRARPPRARGGRLLRRPRRLEPRERAPRRRRQHLAHRLLLDAAGPRARRRGEARERPEVHHGPARGRRSARPGLRPGAAPRRGRKTCWRPCPILRPGSSATPPWPRPTRRSRACASSGRSSCARPGSRGPFPPASTGSRSCGTARTRSPSRSATCGRSGWLSPAPACSPTGSKTPSDRGREGRARRGAGSGRSAGPAFGDRGPPLRRPRPVEGAEYSEGAVQGSRRGCRGHTCC